MTQARRCVSVTVGAMTLIMARILDRREGFAPDEDMSGKPTMDDVALNQTYAHALARIFVRPLIGTWVRPNHLTMLRLIVGLAACVLLAVGSRTTAAWSGILWTITCVLDQADGELARLGDTAVPLGLLASGSILLSIWCAEMFERLSGPGVKAWSGVQRFHPDDALFLLAPITWLGWLAPILVASSICTPVIAVLFVARYVMLKRRTSAA
jgi:archaetidylinositol phosphate synthase